MLPYAYFANYTYVSIICISLSVYVYHAGTGIVYIPFSARNKDQKLVGRFLKIGYFIGYYSAVPLKMCGKFGGFWSAEC